jgi:HlyD family secretion protein
MKRLLLVLVLLGLLAAGAAYWISSGSNGAENGFSYEEVKYDSMTDLVNATGIVKPRDVALVFCKVPGTVEEIYGKVGQKVEKGQPLFKVGSQMAQFSVERAQAGLKAKKALRESAKSALDLMNKIKESSTVGLTKEREVEVQTKYDAAVEGVEEAETALKQARLAIEWTTVKSPIAGTIIEKNLYIGQPVGPSAAAGGGSGSSGNLAAPSVPGGASSGPSISSFMGMGEAKIPFIIAADLNDLEIYAQIPQGDIGKVKAGLKAKFTVDAFPDEPPLEGEVRKVANRQLAKDPNAPKAVPEEANWILRPFMTVNVDITREVHKNVWMLPSAALSFTLDGYYIKQDARDRLNNFKPANPSDWKTVWIMQGKNPWPIFAKIGGKNDQGRPGISYGSYAEVLDWDKDTKKAIDPNKPETYPKVIIAAPQPKQSIFDKPTLKLS